MGKGAYVGVLVVADCCCATVLASAARHPESDVDGRDCGCEADEEAGGLHVGRVKGVVDMWWSVRFGGVVGELVLSLWCSGTVLTSGLIARVEDQDAQVTLHLSM
jgi:hypothetical protein